MIKKKPKLLAELEILEIHFLILTLALFLLARKVIRKEAAQQ